MNLRIRKKEIFLEFMSDKDFINQDIFLPSSFSDEKKLFLNFDKNFIWQDRFCVKMETDDFVVNPERIKGFKIDSFEKNKILKIKTYIQLNEWLNDFKNIDLIKIYFFDSNGNLLKNSFDYDVDYMDFTLECDYKFRDYLVPIFSYKILDF